MSRLRYQGDVANDPYGRRSTTATINSQPTSAGSSRSGSQSQSDYSSEEGSSGTGVYAGSRHHSDPLHDEEDEDDDWAYSEELDSASRPASRPRAPSRHITESRQPSVTRGPVRRNTTTSNERERQSRRPPISRVHRAVAAPPSSVDPLEEYPGYGRGYPAPQPGPFGARVPPPGYAQSSYSSPNTSGYAPFGAAGALTGALTQYGGPGGFQYPSQNNPFSPQPAATPSPGGAGYFNGHHHAMSGHSTPGGYQGHEIMPYPPHPGYGNYPGYSPQGMQGGGMNGMNGMNGMQGGMNGMQGGMNGMQGGMNGMPGGGMNGMQPGMASSMSPQQMQFGGYPQWPPSEPSVIGVPDPETEKKLLAAEELLRNQKLDFERAQKELAFQSERAQKELADRDAKEAADRAAIAAAKKAAEERAIWERKVEDEKRAALASYEAAQRAAAEAKAEAAKKEAEQKIAWQKQLEEEKRQTLINYENQQKAAAEARAAAERRAAEEKLAWERKLEDEKRTALLNYEATLKAAAEARAEAERKAAEEKALWERKLDEERKAAMAKGAENARKAREAEEKKAAEKAAEEKEKADAAAELARVKKEAADEMNRLKKEAADEAAKIKKAADEISEKLKKEAADALAKALEKPPDDVKKPIKFKDAVGRKFSFPFHLCATWAGMEELIRQAFLHVDVIGPHVAEGHYDLIGPNGEIILPQVWETMIEPDWAVTMHMWPIPEPPKAPPGPPPGAQFDPRPTSRHKSGRNSHGPPPVPPSNHRGPPPPPPPSNWPPPGAQGQPPRPPPGMRSESPRIIEVAPRGEKKSSKSRGGASGGVLGWMAGSAGIKPSGKGPKKAEQFDDSCRVM